MNIATLESWLIQLRDALTKKAYVSPQRVGEGDLAFADGVAWNPGHGPGLYQHVGGLWLPLRPVKPAYAQVRRVTAQTLAAGVYDPIVWESEDFDTHGMWSSGSTLTMPFTGLYWFSLSLRVAYSTATGLAVQLVNGPLVLSRETKGVDTLHYVSHQWVARMVQGDSLQASAYGAISGTVEVFDPLPRLMVVGVPLL